ncbi:MAG: hypothetical protein IH840_05050, partial [Candidatus Heimdallarchaeota archaeon]|nr:hypothetical protein [Candidatus Heimdallarchaeota archaeon]
MRIKITKKYKFWIFAFSIINLIYGSASIGSFYNQSISENLPSDSDIYQVPDSQLITHQSSSTIKNYRQSFPTFSWYDAKTNGVNLGLQGLDVDTSVSLPFEFDFYGQTFDTLNINSHGWMSFVDFPPNTYEGPKTYENPTLPTNVYSYVIAPFWNELFAENNIYFWDMGTAVVIEFNNYSYIGPADSDLPLAGTFELILYDDGNIVFQYQTIYIDGRIGTAYTDCYGDVDRYGGFCYSTVGLNLGIDLEYYSEYNLDSNRTSF